MSPISLQRQGAIAPLALLFLIPVLASIVFVIELSRVSAIHAELQRSADAAAISACWELYDEANRQMRNPQTAVLNVRNIAGTVMAANRAEEQVLLLDTTTGNGENKQLTIGQWHSNHLTPWVNASSPFPNAVRVVAQRTEHQNGSIAMVFGKLLSVDYIQASTSAIARFHNDFSGFGMPSEGNLEMLPFTVNIEVWKTYLENRDNDSTLEFNMFPQSTGLAGNSGTVNLVGNINSTNTLRRHIVEGLSAEEMEWLPNGRMELGADGTMVLNGNTGISAGMQHALSQVLEQPKILPLYSTASGNGNNAQYTIVGFTGVQINSFSFKGSKNSAKNIMISPRIVAVNNGIMNPGSEKTSDFIISRVELVR